MNFLESIRPRIKSLLFFEAMGFLTGFTDDGLCKMPASKADSAMEAVEKSLPK